MNVVEVPSYNRSVGRRTAPGRTKGLKRKPSTLKRAQRRTAVSSRKKKIYLEDGRKLLSLNQADSRFSEQIRSRDGVCLYPNCGTTLQLTCSHYFGRATKSTRFDPDNCITLCRTHHYWDKDIGWEFQKQRIGEKGCDWDGRYTLFMMERLGKERWEMLLARAKEFVSQKKAIQAFMEAESLNQIFLYTQELAALNHTNGQSAPPGAPSSALHLREG